MSLFLLFPCAYNICKYVSVIKTPIYTYKLENNLVFSMNLQSQIHFLSLIIEFLFQLSRTA